MKKRIIAVNSNCYHGYSIEQAIDGIAAAGFRYIELTATKGWTEHVFPDQSFERLWQVKERLAEKGLTPFSMSGHCNLMDTERIHGLCQQHPPGRLLRLRLYRLLHRRGPSGGSGRGLQRGGGGAHPRPGARAGELRPHPGAGDPRRPRERQDPEGDRAIGWALPEWASTTTPPTPSSTATWTWGRICDASMDAIRYMHLKDKGGAADGMGLPRPGQGLAGLPPASST